MGGLGCKDFIDADPFQQEWAGDASTRAAHS